MLENNKNLTCGFADELVSYLYDEMAGTDKARFEKHLQACSACAEELSDFSSARSSILEWRNEEFLPLQIPTIEIPYEKKAEFVETKSVSRPWFASIRDFFTLSPAWMTATTAFAALAICVGLFAVVVSYLRDKTGDVAEKGNTKIVPSPTTGNQNQNSNISNSNLKNHPQNKSSEPSSSSNNQKPTTESVPIRISNGSNVPKPQNLDIRKTVLPKSENKVNKSPVKTPKQKTPSLIEEEDEDDSLRLSDILEEIGMR